MKKIIIALVIALVVISGWGLGNQANNEKVSGKTNENSEVKTAGELPWHLSDMKLAGELPWHLSIRDLDL